MTNRYLLTAAGYIIASFSVAVPWHMMIFHETYAALGAITRTEPIVPLGLVAMLLQAAVIAWLFPVYLDYRNGQTGERRPYRDGITFSLMMGIMVWSVMVFATAAKIEIAPVIDFIMLGTAFQLLQFLLVGVVIGFIHRRYA